MKVVIVMCNPNNPEKPTRLTSADCKTLDDVADTAYFFMKNCRIIRVEASD